MQKRLVKLEHKSNRLVIPDAYIIDEMSDSGVDAFDESGLTLPSSHGFDLDEPSTTVLEDSAVIVIDL